jgi:hypothetical protein
LSVRATPSPAGAAPPGCRRPPRAGLWATLALALLPLAAALPAAAQTLLLDGAFVQAPAAPDWERVRLDGQTAVLRQRTDTGTTTLTFRVDGVPPVPDDETFFRQTQARQDTALAGYELASLHFERVLRRGTPCLRYVGTFRDRASGVPDAERHLALRGLWCRHPAAAARQLVQVELALRTPAADPAGLAAMIDVADRTFDTLTFVPPSFMARP